VTKLRRRDLHPTRARVRLRGRSHDVGCRSATGASLAGAVANVYVSVAKVRGHGAGQNCRFVDVRGRLTRARSCRRAIFLPARGRGRWTFSLRAHLPAGHYRVVARALDRARNKERPKKGRNILLFSLR